MWLVLACGAFQTIAVSAVHPSWWVPNLVLAALVEAIRRRPRQWALCAGLAGALTVAWAARWQAGLMAGYVLIGWIVRQLVRVLDVDRLGLQLGITAAAAAALTLGCVAAERSGSAGLAALGAAHVGLTVLAALLMRRVEVQTGTGHE